MLRQARTGWRGHHPLGANPFALSAASGAAVERGREAQLPFLGLILLVRVFKTITAMNVDVAFSQAFRLQLGNVYFVLLAVFFF